MKVLARAIFTMWQGREVELEIDALNRIDQIIQVSYVQVKIVTKWLELTKRSQNLINENYLNSNMWRLA